jgi:ubiquinone/menaquinone biosynthesis C-methylase UbiE
MNSESLITRNDIAATAGYIYKYFWKNKMLPLTNYPFDLKSNSYLLDIGCGWGRFLLPVMNNEIMLVGIDINFKYLQKLKTLRKSSNIYLVLADCEYLPFRNEIFDYIFSNSVFQHLERRKFYKTILKIQTLLNKKSLFVFQIPNKHSVRGFIHYFLKFEKREKKRSPFYIRYYDIIQLKHLFSSNFSIKIEGYSLLFFENNKEHHKYFPIPIRMLLISLYYMTKLFNFLKLQRFIDSIWIYAYKIS